MILIVLIKFLLQFVCSMNMLNGNRGH